MPRRRHISAASRCARHVEDALGVRLLRVVRRALKHAALRGVEAELLDAPADLLQRRRLPLHALRREALAAGRRRARDLLHEPLEDGPRAHRQPQRLTDASRRLAWLGLGVGRRELAALELVELAVSGLFAHHPLAGRQVDLLKLGQQIVHHHGQFGEAVDPPVGELPHARRVVRHLALAHHRAQLAQLALGALALLERGHRACLHLRHVIEVLLNLGRWRRPLDLALDRRVRRGGHLPGAAARGLPRLRLARLAHYSLAGAALLMLP